MDEPIHAVIKRAAQLERRKVTDFCMTALADAVRAYHCGPQQILSDQNRSMFCDALVSPKAPSERRQRAFADQERRGSLWTIKHALGIFAPDRAR